LQVGRGSHRKKKRGGKEGESLRLSLWSRARLLQGRHQSLEPQRSRRPHPLQKRPPRWCTIQGTSRQREKEKRRQRQRKPWEEKAKGKEEERREARASLGRSAKEAELLSLLEKSRAGGLLEQSGSLSLPCQSLNQKRARSRRGERLREGRSQSLESRSERAKEGSKRASLLPEPRGESLSQSEGEEKEGEKLLPDLLPWERAKEGERLRDGREGGSLREAKRREHEKESEGAASISQGLADNKKKRRPVPSSRQD
jgi:hypothetical protein